MANREASAAHLARLSVLGGAAHLWPHCGPTNARLRLHVPLSVPEGDYRLVLGDREHRWRCVRACVRVSVCTYVRGTRA